MGHRASSARVSAAYYGHVCSFLNIDQRIPIIDVLDDDMEEKDDGSVESPIPSDIDELLLSE